MTNHSSPIKSPTASQASSRWRHTTLATAEQQIHGNGMQPKEHDVKPPPLLREVAESLALDDAAYRHDGGIPLQSEPSSDSLPSPPLQRTEAQEHAPPVVRRRPPPFSLPPGAYHVDHPDASVCNDDDIDTMYPDTASILTHTTTLGYGEDRLVVVPHAVLVDEEAPITTAQAGPSMDPVVQATSVERAPTTELSSDFSQQHEESDKERNDAKASQSNVEKLRLMLRQRRRCVWIFAVLALIVIAGLATGLTYTLLEIRKRQAAARDKDKSRRPPPPPRRTNSTGNGSGFASGTPPRRLNATSRKNATVEKIGSGNRADGSSDRKNGSEQDSFAWRLSPAGVQTATIRPTSHRSMAVLRQESSRWRRDLAPNQPGQAVGG